MFAQRRDVDLLIVRHGCDERCVHAILELSSRGVVGGSVGLSSHIEYVVFGDEKVRSVHETIRWIGSRANPRFLSTVIYERIDALETRGGLRNGGPMFPFLLGFRRIVIYARL